MTDDKNECKKAWIDIGIRFSLNKRKDDNQ